MHAASPTPSATASEIAKFTALADQWWDPAGPFRPLHKFNPARIRLIRDRLAAHFRRTPGDTAPFAGLSLLDIGCGGGLVAEPMSRLGFAVTGIDAGDENLGVARVHAERQGLSIAYQTGGPETLLDRGLRFDAVLAMEVVEHVDDVPAFFQSAATLLAPGGMLIAATLNRTLKSLALAKIGAEYVLRWVPAGTHDWRKFVRPHELASHLRGAGLALTALTGLSYDLLTDRWQESGDIDVNYFAVAVKE
ncbi:MAG: bifunctional 2-polyprenyl-6-hydroxyphenol methylase/3-demethylubiquinol 3-O-methyltransferase UbiG [Rhodospirillaceae bacterium]|nr:bifunctional 2-polyprenyl-6-hydroxyphenol methylase/3-demethylubiquinol 3-O-methyltransferase UbiG [Rhodospirillaceae bacterium]